MLNGAPPPHRPSHRCIDRILLLTLVSSIIKYNFTPYDSIDLVDRFVAQVGVHQGRGYGVGRGAADDLMCVSVAQMPLPGLRIC